ncbi:unnamed protein product, partial [marine sediment metagenome]
MKLKHENMRKQAQKGFFAATDLADYLVEKGVPFREAHGMVGKLVKHCLKENKSFEDLALKDY